MMNTTQEPLPQFQEERSAKIPALSLLCNLGWTFLSPEQALAARGDRTSEVVLKEILRSELRKRRFNFAGKEHPLSERTIDGIVAEMSTPALNEGLAVANEKLYNHMLLGISVTEFMENGKKATPTIQLIDWVNPANNSFCFTEEFSVQRTNRSDHRRPDIVCFVNGLPLVVIEAKRPDSKTSGGPIIEEGISQNIRNQRQDEIPRLFAYSQLLLSINGSEGQYATQGTPAKFWSVWREEVFTEAEMFAQKNKKLTHQQKDPLFGHRSKQDREWYDSLIAGGELAVTDQDRLLISLLTPERLLEMTRLFILFDKKTGKLVARYQQVFGIKRLLERIKTRRPDGSRKGGITWHTTGSGKSLTMVFLSRALVLLQDLAMCRIVLVTDRKDLENQLSNTFSSTGELSGKKGKSKAKMTTGRQLAAEISHGTERILFSLIDKFRTATKLPECRNESSDLIVLVDEGHRSHGGENHIRMKQAMPNAAFIAFTGTPLLKESKKTNKFGPIIHAYTMQRAVEDGTITPLLYEERIPDLDVNERAIDRWFERVTDGLTTQQKADLKRKYARKKEVYQAEDRLRLIALDIAFHFSKNIDEGLKGQLACGSKLDAIRYKKFLDELGEFESAVVISAPDSREGNKEVDESNIPEVTKWWQDNVGNQKDDDYANEVIERFDKDDKLKLLIVVDKLLTGFDEPKNTVLYIDKPLKQHNLIQAIARVNRLHPLKEFGLLIDYRGILGELDTTLKDYQDLASRTQAGFDVDDLEGLYSQMSTEYKRLPRLYDELRTIFADVKNKADIEAMRQVLVPKMEERNGELVDVHLKVREDFYSALSAFTRCLKVALQSSTFFEDKSFTEADRDHYKDTVKQFSSLRKLAMQDAGESVNYDEYAEKIKKLMDKHVVGVEVREPAGVYEVARMGARQKPEEWSEDKIRNETDIIKTRIARKIEQDLDDDPYAKAAFSKLLKDAIREAEALFDHPLKQYLLFKEFNEDLEERKLDEIPDQFEENRHAQALFGIFKIVLPEVIDPAENDDLQVWIDLAFTVDSLVNTSVAENSINPQNIEASIRKTLLPLLFKKCKEVGAGMDQAKLMVEYIVRMTRKGVSSVG
ncbi:HsdR family type I site-specific deoxyribonuclease [Endozoicomonas sp. 4G]|uniref:type I restriction endonuclease subunit R n=1 Tax=Endozoicomonas sp. 4G TaxID=2872754 RepID=UPI002078737D|nr:HsdR family type I site-specific deoxyribonuclease [Endozoicomonas sp. 4G]